MRGVGGGGAPFNPAKVADLYVDLNAALVTLVGGNVSVLPNQTANPGLDLTQGVAGARPLWNASDADFGGKPSITFDGVDDALGSAVNAYAYGAHTIFMVAKSAGQAGFRPFYRRDSTSSDIDYCSHRVDAIFVRNAALVVSYKTNASDWGATGALTARVEYGGTHASHLLYKNGAAVTLATGTGNNPGTALNPGSFAIFGPGVAMGGDFVRLLIYTRVLSAAESAYIEAGLRSLYAHY